MQEHKIILSEGNLIEVELYAEDDFEKAGRLVSRFLKIIEEHKDETFTVLVDLSAGSHSADPATIKVYKTAIEHPQIRKIAFVGVIDEVQKVFVDFAIKFAKKDSVQFFDSIPPAKTWLAL